MCYIHVPPSTVVVHTVPSVLNGVVLIGYSVNSIARNILATAERGKQMGKIKANTLLGAECFANIEILEKHMVVIVVFNKRSLGKMLFKLTISSDRYTSIVVISLLRNITFLILPIEVFRLLLNKKRIGDIIAHSDIGQGTV